MMVVMKNLLVLQSSVMLTRARRPFTKNPWWPTVVMIHVRYTRAWKQKQRGGTFSTQQSQSWWCSRNPSDRTKTSVSCGGSVRQGKTDGLPPSATLIIRTTYGSLLILLLSKKKRPEQSGLMRCWGLRRSSWRFRAQTPTALFNQSSSGCSGFMGLSSRRYQSENILIQSKKLIEEWCDASLPDGFWSQRGNNLEAGLELCVISLTEQKKLTPELSLVAHHGNCG